MKPSAALRGFSVIELAAKLGITESTVRYALVTGRLRVNDDLSIDFQPAQRRSARSGTSGSKHAPKLRGLTIMEIQRRTGYSRPTIYQAIREGRLVVYEDLTIELTPAKTGRPRKGAGR